MALPETLVVLKDKPSSYLLRVDYESLTSALTGFDLACHGGLLIGFREWLLVRANSAKNMSWQVLVLHLAFPDSSEPQTELKSDEGQSLANESLFKLLSEFRSEKSKFNGMHKILNAAHRDLNA